MKLRKKYLVLAMAAAFAVPGVQAETQLDFTDTIKLSDSQTPDLGMAFKTKLVRLGNGTLITAFGDGVNADNVVYDLKGDKERPARDIFIRTCASAAVDCSVDENWTDPVNISNSATKSSMTTDWQGDNGDPSAYWGDSDKPNITNGGANLMLTWTDKYCDALAGDDDGTNQRSVSYLTRENREIPFSCTYAAYSFDAGKNWTAPEQLSDGSRDAKQDVSKVNSMGKSVITWQEDPLGLQIGSADGPGDGASGATASHGTDIWFTTTTNETTKTDPDTGLPIAGKPTGFNSIARLTDNATSQASGNHNVIKNALGNVVADGDIDGGQAAATRANTGLVGPQIVVAYEETKGSEGLDIGKFVRYHNFNYTTDPSSVAVQPGCILSNPEENARRVRFIPQATPGPESGIQLGIFWKEGRYDQGGPSDIMVRIAKDGISPDNMTPAVDAGCATSDFLVAEDLDNAPAINISSNAPTATADNLTDTTETNNIENALAHRGAIVGDDMYIGYSYTSDWALANYTTLENYDFWLRHYDGVTDTWTDPKNLSNLPTKELNVREPRFVKASFSTIETDNYNPEAFIIAWGLQTNVAAHIEDPEELDIMYTRSFDKGETMEPIVRVANPDGNGRYESQLRLSPDGQTVYAAWNEESASDGGTDAVFAVASTVDAVEGEDPYAGLPGVSSAAATSSSSSSGCSVSENAKFDPVLPALLASALAFLGFRRYRKNG